MRVRSLTITAVVFLLSVSGFARQSQKSTAQQPNPPYQQQPMTPDKTVSGMNPNAEKPSSNNSTNRPDDADKAFLKKAAIGDTAEMQLGQMAEQKSSNPKVKAFGQRMVKDHSQNDDLLTNVAQEQHIP